IARAFLFQGFVLDRAGEVEKTDAAPFQQRAKYFVEKTTNDTAKKFVFRTNAVTFIGPLCTDFLKLDKLIPPGNKLRVTLRLTEGKFHLLKNTDNQADNEPYRLVPKNAILHVVQYEPTGKYLDALKRHLDSHPVVYNFESELDTEQCSMHALYN